MKKITLEMLKPKQRMAWGFNPTTRIVKKTYSRKTINESYLRTK